VLCGANMGFMHAHFDEAVASMSALHLEKPSILIEAIDSAVPEGGKYLLRFAIIIC